MNIRFYIIITTSLIIALNISATSLNKDIQVKSDTVEFLKQTNQISFVSNVEINSNLDHRIAMSFLCLGLITEKPIIVRNTDTISSSFPFFKDKMNKIGAKLNFL